MGFCENFNEIFELNESRKLLDNPNNYHISKKDYCAGAYGILKKIKLSL
jgi:hypothetical protein